MEETKLYWTIVAAIISAGWVLTVFIRDRMSQSIERSSAMVSHLLENDKLIIDNPDIPKYISRTAARNEQYFRSEAVLGEDVFYKAKAYVYRQLNSFDEILSISSKTTGTWSFLKPPSVIEISDWETYIRMTLRHPLYRSILNNEKEIFGSSLRYFWDRNKQAIESAPVDPFMW
jgi:hypothetical protein